MTTRCQLVSDHAMKAWEGIMSAVSTDGGKPAIQVIESVMHDLLRADDALEHAVIVSRNEKRGRETRWMCWAWQHIWHTPNKKNGRKK